MSNLDDYEKLLVDLIENFSEKKIPEEHIDSVIMQSAHFFRAIAIFASREDRYRNGWQARGWKGNMADISRKADRMKSMFWKGDYDPSSGGDVLDDAYDLLNYVAFFLRNAGAGNKFGP